MLCRYAQKRHCIARTIKNGELCMTDNLLRTMAIITEKTAAENISGMWATVITGMVVVFLILGLLIGLLYIISFFCNLGNKKKRMLSLTRQSLSLHRLPLLLSLSTRTRTTMRLLLLFQPQSPLIRQVTERPMQSRESNVPRNSLVQAGAMRV